MLISALMEKVIPLIEPVFSNTLGESFHNLLIQDLKFFQRIDSLIHNDFNNCYISKAVPLQCRI